MFEGPLKSLLACSTPLLRPLHFPNNIPTQGSKLGAPKFNFRSYFQYLMLWAQNDIDSVMIKNPRGDLYAHYST